MDTFTSMLAGFTIFAVLGNLAEELGTPISEVIQSGTGLAFISYPMALGKISYLSQVFAFLFFLMLITLGLGSVTGLATGIISIMCDAREDGGGAEWRFYSTKLAAFLPSGFSAFLQYFVCAA